MTENKTQPTLKNVEDFLDAIPDPQKRQDSRTIVRLMEEVTGLSPRMWGENIIGFGDYHYRYATGREGDTFIIGFSPRKQSLTLYLDYGFEQMGEWMNKLGKYKTGKACLYLNNLENVDLDTLKEMIRWSAKQKEPKG